MAQVYAVFSYGGLLLWKTVGITDILCVVNQCGEYGLFGGWMVV
jgi:hypothetical protein